MNQWRGTNTSPSQKRGRCHAVSPSLGLLSCAGFWPSRDGSVVNRCNTDNNTCPEIQRFPRRCDGTQKEAFGCCFGELTRGLVGGSVSSVEQHCPCNRREKGKGNLGCNRRGQCVSGCYTARVILASHRDAPGLLILILTCVVWG